LVKRFDVALFHMRAGEALHLQYCDGRPIWSLSSGSRVAAEAASLLINNPNVVPADLGLFPDLVLGQTWEVKNDQG
jgi:hypothetical protein